MIYTDDCLIGLKPAIVERRLNNLQRKSRRDDNKANGKLWSLKLLNETWKLPSHGRKHNKASSSKKEHQWKHFMILLSIVEWWIKAQRTFSAFFSIWGIYKFIRLGFLSSCQFIVQQKFQFNRFLCCDSYSDLKIGAQRIRFCSFINNFACKLRRWETVGRTSEWSNDQTFSRQAEQRAMRWVTATPNRVIIL